jgi:hypothetical protein
MLNDQKWYYVTIERTQYWNITVQAEDPDDAVEVALESPYDLETPDNSDSAVVNVEEAKGHVE